MSGFGGGPLKPAFDLSGGVSDPLLARLPFLRFRTQQAPRFPVALVAVAVCLDGLHGEEHWARRLTAAVEQDPRRDEVPSFLRDDVADEEVKQLRGVFP